MTKSETPNPKRVAAGKVNRSKRPPLSEETREKLRKAIYRNQPWRYSTGPTSLEGKRRSASNVRWRYAFSDGSMQRRMQEFLATFEPLPPSPEMRPSEGDGTDE